MTALKWRLSRKKKKSSWHSFALQFVRPSFECTWTSSLLSCCLSHVCKARRANWWGSGFWMCLRFRISSEILILNGKQSSIQPHLLSSSLKGCKDEETSIRFIHQYLCELCVWRVSVSTVSKTHFPLSSVLFSHILLCSGRRRPFNSDIRQQARAKPQRSVTSGRGTISCQPYPHPLFYCCLACSDSSRPCWFNVHVTSKVRAISLKKSSNETLPPHPHPAPHSHCEEDEREWRWSHRHQTLEF